MKNIRKITAILLSVVMLLTALPVTTFAATSGDYEYEILAGGTAEITGYTGEGTPFTLICGLFTVLFLFFAELPLAQNPPAHPA